MYIVVLHRFTNQLTAFRRGDNLLVANGAPRGSRVLQFYPSTDRTEAICLWESDSVDELREYVDSTLGDSSENGYFEVDAGIARGLPQPVAV